MVKTIELEQYNIVRHTLKQSLSIIVTRPSSCIECMSATLGLLNQFRLSVCT